jgi:hypothetical protein
LAREPRLTRLGAGSGRRDLGKHRSALDPLESLPGAWGHLDHVHAVEGDRFHAGHLEGLGRDVHGGVRGGHRELESLGARRGDDSGHGLEVPVHTDLFQPGTAELGRDVLRGDVEAGGAVDASAQGVRGEEREMAAQRIDRHRVEGAAVLRGEMPGRRGGARPHGGGDHENGQPRGGRPQLAHG